MFARFATLALAAVLGAIGGGAFSIYHAAPFAGDYDFLKEHGPPPHHIPPQPGGISFRFAMIHDVLHERYPKHGPAYYRETERIAREKLATLPRDVQAAFLATDDLAIALARQGRRAEALQLLQRSLLEQERAKVSENARYATYANIGFISMEERESRFLAGEAGFGQLATDGAEFTRRAWHANPNAHFNRLGWHLKLQESIFQALRRNRDFLGNPMQESLRQVFASTYPLAPAAWKHNPEDPVQRFLHDTEPSTTTPARGRITSTIGCTLRGFNPTRTAPAGFHSMNRCWRSWECGGRANWAGPISPWRSAKR